MRCKLFRRRLAAAAAALLLAGPALGQNAFQLGLDAYLNGEYDAAMAHWRPAAESGDAVAAFNVGVLYAQGLGVRPDHAEAVRWYRRSAHAGYANGQFNLGAAYYSGEGTEVNIAQAVSWWGRAAAQDHPEALYNLATLYRRGEGVARDTRHAVELFNRAAALGDSRAREALTEIGSPADGGGDAGTTRTDAGGAAPREPSPDDTVTGGPLADENPAHWTVQVFAGTEEQAARRFARDHDLPGLRIYRAEIDGKTWYKGIYGSYGDRDAAGDAKRDLAQKLPGADPWVRSFRAIQAEAVGGTLVRQAAADSSPATQPADDAATPTTGGEGEPDEPPAVAGTTDPAPAAAPAAGNDSSGDGGGTDPDGDVAALRQGQKAFNTQNYARAFEAWRPLAEKGAAEAQYGIGFMYESGWGVQRDYAEAFRWYQRAAQQGHVKAQYNLGMLYRNGQGVARNDALGLYWIQTAADRGDERAQGYLDELN